MTPEFLAAVIDTLLPGDEVLPSGANAGLVVTIHASTHRDVLDAIGAEAFVRGDAAARSRILTSVEQRMPDAFRALLAAILSEYYESAPVLAALGWHLDPPQPHGHELPRFGDDVTPLLEKVKQRTKLWRA